MIPAASRSGVFFQKDVAQDVRSKKLKQSPVSNLAASGK
jgi:hypothetical protein